MQYLGIFFFGGRCSIFTLPSFRGRCSPSHTHIHINRTLANFFPDTLLTSGGFCPTRSQDIILMWLKIAPPKMDLQRLPENMANRSISTLLRLHEWLRMIGERYVIFLHAQKNSMSNIIKPGDSRWQSGKM